MEGQIELPAEPLSICKERTFERDEQHQLEFSFFAVMCFLLKVWHFDVSPSLLRGQRGLREAERSGHLGLPFKHRGAVPFPESRKPSVEEAPWVWFLSFPPLTPFLVGVQECSQGSTSVASCGHFLTLRNKTSTQQSSIDSFIVPGTLSWEVKCFTISVCTRSQLCFWDTF